MDRISGLPDGVISHILLFLPTEGTALTSVLSKRWRNLFAFSANLELVEKCRVAGGQSFVDFVDRLLSVSRNTSIETFSLGLISKAFDQDHLNRCLCDVLNRGVVDMYLCTYDLKDWYSVPLEMFTCKTLVKLKLTDFFICEFPKDAFLPALKTLILQSVKFRNPRVCAFQKLLSGCPVLEDLSVIDLNWDKWVWSRSISSPSLKRLRLKRWEVKGFNGSNFKSITLDTPSLTYLHYCDFIPCSYQVVNLNSLVEAKLDLKMTIDYTWDPKVADDYDNITSNSSNLIKGLRNVESMKLKHHTLEMFYFFRGAITLFENLPHLSFKPSFGCCWRGLPHLLNISPNLESLTIKGRLHYSTSKRQSYVCECLSGYSFLLSCPLKVLKISKYDGDIEEKEQLKHFLGKLSSLKLLEVKFLEWHESMSKVTKKLLEIPRASSECKIDCKIKHKNLFE